MTTGAERCIALSGNLAVDILSVADLENRDFTSLVVYQIDNAMVALPNSEPIRVSRQLFTSVWPGIVG